MFPFRGFRKMFTKRSLFKSRPRSAPRRIRKRRAPKATSVLRKKFTTIEDRIIVPQNSFVSGSDTYELSDMPQLSQYVALYENYKIEKITVVFRSLCPVNVISNGTTGVSLGMLHTKLDYNDSDVPTASAVGIQAMMNDNSYRSAKSSRDLRRTFVPKWLSRAGTADNATQKTGWLRTNSANVSHYGFKYIIEGGYNIGAPLGPNVIYEPIVTYHIAFKDPQ